MVDDQALADFCAAVDAMRAPAFADMPESLRPYAKPLRFERGVKFARIVKNDGCQESVFCFVRLDDGAILKAAGWKAPAKHARGNIANGAADVGVYGPAYLR
jgi:hypothetical protein